MAQTREIRREVEEGRDDFGGKWLAAAKEKPSLVIEHPTVKPDTRKSKETL